MRERYVIPDRGKNRAFVVARDELQVTTAARVPRTQVLAGIASAEAARRTAERLRRTTGETASVVLYEEGVPRSKFTRRVLTEKIAVKLAPGRDAAGLAAAQGLANRGPVSPGARWFIFETPTTGGAIDAAALLRARPGVLAAEPQMARLQHKRFTPNDTYFTQQWHLQNTGQSGSLAGTDVNVTSVWDNYKGTGIRIGIVDDGVQTSHPDFVGNIDTVNDYNWNDGNVNDPSPNIAAGDEHGHACAGVAGARGNNATGVSGAAPEATIVGLRLIGGSTGSTDQDDHDAMLWKNDIIAIKSNSWGPDDDGRTLEAPGPLLADAFTEAAASGRGGLGTIITWAAGNGGEDGDDSNYDGFANSIYTIAVGAIGNDGVRAPYSEPGANVLVAAPSDGGSLGIVTTDLTGNDGYNSSSSVGNLSNRSYTNDFGGTSSACPLAAGCIALLLESKPTLGWRDVREILIRSAKKCDANDQDWITNGAGFHFNHNYGAGLLDAQAAVNLAATWTNLPAAQSTTVVPTVGGSSSIPDNSATGVTRTFHVTQSLRAEQVTVTVDITHSHRGHLEITLTSPSGTVSRLAELHQTTLSTVPTALANYANWTFMTVRDWGENSVGTWTLKVADRVGGRAGSLASASLTIHGTPANVPPTISAATIAPTDGVFSDQALMVTGVTANDAEGDSITLGYQWQESADGTNFVAIAGANAASLALTGAQSGWLVRCAVTATSTGQNSAPFFTDAVAVDHRPNQLARHGVAYSYDSDLFLPGGSGGGSFSRAAIINEFSQGPTGGSSEWVELLTTQTADLRGWSIADSTGTYTTFANVAAWSAVPAGTLIVIYNGAAARDSLIPPDDFTVADGVLILAYNNAAYFTAGSGFALGNGGDSLLLKNAAATVVDGLSYGTGSGQTPDFPSVGSATAAAFTGSTEAEAEVIANWSVIAQTSATPGAANGGKNPVLISSLRAGAVFRFAAESELVPGLAIDPVTGLVSGTPDLAGGGFFHVVIERSSGVQSVTRTFPLLVADASGNYFVPAGKTWALNNSSTLAGDLTVLGTLDTAGRALTVNGTLATAGATVLNASGVLAFSHRSGPLPPGAISLIANPINDSADDDADGLANLLELLLGTDPGSSSLPTPVVSLLPTGRLRLAVALPIGPIDVFPTVEVSGDLIHWENGPGFTAITGDSTAAGLRTLTVESVSSAAPLFIRLRAAR